MKIIGLIGGMSWESTAIYYRRLNEEVRRRRGGLYSAEIVLRSLDFTRIVALQHLGDWDGAADILAAAAQQLEAMGASMVLICTNTMHKVAEQVQRAITIPLLHITDPTARAVCAGGCQRPLLLATRYTMEQNFYLDRLRQQHGLSPVIPCEPDRALIHDIIFDELCRGVIHEESRATYRAVIARGIARGADSVILGCTEIGLLIGPADCPVPLFDSTTLHADAALDACL
ncbi:MAG: aspartate/glutamate racemase family protein [Acidocella sp.]|nr:aspartate/glutamate racemase family protein [Acidocella sp.]